MNLEKKWVDVLRKPIKQTGPNLAQPMRHPGQHPPPYNCARPQVRDRKLASIRALRYCMRPQALRPQAHIQIEAASIYTDSGRKPQHARTAAHRHARGKGVGKGGGRLKSSCTQREGGGGCDSPPLYAPNTPTFITAIKNLRV